MFPAFTPLRFSFLVHAARQTTPLPLLPAHVFPAPPAPQVVTSAVLRRLDALSHEAPQHLHRTRGIPLRPLPQGQRFSLSNG